MSEVKKDSPISFALSPELKEKFQTEADKQNMSLRAYMKQFVEGHVSGDKSEKDTDSDDIFKGDDYLKLMTDQNDLVIELLQELNDFHKNSNPFASEADKDDQEEEDKDNQDQDEIRDEIEAELRSKYLLLELSEEQKSLFLDLVSYRNETDRICSQCPEKLFYFMMHQTFYSSFNKRLPGFDDRFEEAYSDYLSEEEI